jgi:hypothetical protein
MNGPKVTSALSPFDSQLRTLVGAGRRSYLCHKSGLEQAQQKTRAVARAARPHFTGVTSGLPFSINGNQLHRRRPDRAFVMDCTSVQSGPPRRCTVNTEPLPGSLVTVTSPPVVRASLRERARSSPCRRPPRGDGICLGEIAGIVSPAVRRPRGRSSAPRRLPKAPAAGSPAPQCLHPAPRSRWPRWARRSRAGSTSSRADRRPGDSVSAANEIFVP